MAHIQAVPQAAHLLLVIIYEFSFGRHMGLSDWLTCSLKRLLFSMIIGLRQMWNVESHIFLSDSTQTQRSGGYSQQNSSHL